jgi:ribosomal protein S18 acetylase RimI-like enzyme
MELVENNPLDTHAIAKLIADRHDLFLVWPLAKHPFDHDQWKAVLNPTLGNKSFLVHHGDRFVGHAALCVTEDPLAFSVSFLYLLPELRSQGLGKRLMALLEAYAREQLSAKQLVLVARVYNAGALHCYTRCGFHEIGRQGTLIRMSKMLYGMKRNQV